MEKQYFLPSLSYLTNQSQPRNQRHTHFPLVLPFEVSLLFIQPLNYYIGLFQIYMLNPFLSTEEFSNATFVHWKYQSFYLTC